jgi:uncharacterized protein (TIGR03067 family)
MCALLQVLLLAGSPLSQPPKADAVPAELTGKWYTVSVERDGKTGDADKEGRIPAGMTIKGDSVTLESGVPFAFYFKATGTLKVVGVEKKVLQVDLKYKAVASTRDGDKVSEGTIKGLWELTDKDTLRMCRSAEDGERPTGFDTKQDDGKITYTFRRVKE